MRETTFKHKAIADLVFAYRNVHGHHHRPLSYREFADACNRTLSNTAYRISHQTVKNWEDRVHLPRSSFLLYLSLSKENWPAEFGKDALAALQPEKRQPATYIGVRALDRSKIKTGPLKKRFDPYYISPP